MSFLRVSLSAWLGQRGPAFVQMLAMLAVAAGVGLWGSFFLAPRPVTAPPALAVDSTPGHDITPVTRWFGGGSARLRVAVVGLISSGQHGAALLSINGEPARAYRVGQMLAQGVTLSAVFQQGVSIDQDGIVEDVIVPGLPLPPQGFVQVQPAQFTDDR